MKVLKLWPQAVAAYRAKHSQYWLDRLVEQVLKANARPDQVNITGRVLAIITPQDHDLAPLIVPGVNLVGLAGNQWWAEVAAGQTPTIDFKAAAAGSQLGSSNTAPTNTDTQCTTPLAGSTLAIDAGYPKTNDANPPNTSAGVRVLSWSFSYPTGNTFTGVIEGAIINNRTTPTACETHYLFSSTFNVTTTDTLRVFVDQSPTGV